MKETEIYNPDGSVNRAAIWQWYIEIIKDSKGAENLTDAEIEAMAASLASVDPRGKEK